MYNAIYLKPPPHSKAGRKTRRLLPGFDDLPNSMEAVRPKYAPLALAGPDDKKAPAGIFLAIISMKICSLCAGFINETHGST
jgi:hypothetical protein